MRPRFGLPVNGPSTAAAAPGEEVKEEGRPDMLLESARRPGAARVISAIGMVDAPPPSPPPPPPSTSPVKSSLCGFGLAPLAPNAQTFSLLRLLGVVVAAPVADAEANARALPPTESVPAKCCLEPRRRTLLPRLILAPSGCCCIWFCSPARSFREPPLLLAAAAALALPPEMRWLVRWMTPVTFFMALVVAVVKRESVPSSGTSSTHWGGMMRRRCGQFRRASHQFGLVSSFSRSTMKEKISQKNHTTEAISTATRTRRTSAFTRKGERTLSWSSIVVVGCLERWS